VTQPSRLFAPLTCSAWGVPRVGRLVPWGLRSFFEALEEYIIWRGGFDWWPPLWKRLLGSSLCEALIGCVVAVPLCFPATFGASQQHRCFGFRLAWCAEGVDGVVSADFLAPFGLK